MEGVFKITRGRYDVPGIGKVDATKEVGNDIAMKLYLLPRRIFPFIKLGEDALPFLKKQKLTVNNIASLIKNAKSTSEIETLLQLTDSKTVKGIADVRLAVLNLESK